MLPDVGRRHSKSRIRWTNAARKLNARVSCECRGTLGLLVTHVGDAASIRRVLFRTPLKIMGQQERTGNRESRNDAVCAQYTQPGRYNRKHTVENNTDRFRFERARRRTSPILFNKRRSLSSIVADRQSNKLVLSKVAVKKLISEIYFRPSMRRRRHDIFKVKYFTRQKVDMVLQFSFFFFLTSI